MRKWAVFGLVSLIIGASAGSAFALDNGGFWGRCSCFCSSDNGHATVQMFYQSHGYYCAVFENHTCNLEDPTTGLVVGGTTIGCTESSGHFSVEATPSSRIDGSTLPQVQFQTR